jgi:hypothetical protein
MRAHLRATGTAWQCLAGKDDETLVGFADDIGSFSNQSLPINHWPLPIIWQGKRIVTLPVNGQWAMANG